MRFYLFSLVLLIVNWLDLAYDRDCCDVNRAYHALMEFMQQIIT
jgi:hypothetical protein